MHWGAALHRFTCMMTDVMIDPLSNNGPAALVGGRPSPGAPLLKEIPR
ncbi:hypothetical protein J2848_005100 [Azospirillum lipoferum]|nr:hypothetical protein [Azospirillum lipoferum]